MPASPATPAPSANAWTLNLNTGLPATAATVSSSRIARSTRPNGERRRRSRAARAAAASTIAAGHATTSGVPPTANRAEVYAPTAKDATTPRFTRPASPHWTFRPSVSRARTPTSVTMAVRYAVTRDPSRAGAGETGRPHEQHREDDREADRRLVRRWDRKGADLFHHADDQGARERAGRGPDAAEDGRGKDRDDEPTPHQRIDAGVETEEHARAARERTAADGGERDHALGGHPLDGRELRIVGGRAHRDAEPCPEEKRLGERHHDHRDAKDEQLITADPEPGDAQGARDRHVVAPKVIPPDEADDVLQDERDADRCDGQRERPPIAHGPERDAIDPERDGAGHDERAEPGQRDRGSHAVVQHQRGVGADGEIRADGEVRKAREPPEERERDGRQREDAARDDAVEDVLRDRRHPPRGIV